MESDAERAPNPSSHHHQPLRPAKSAAFKREERRKRKDRKRQERLADELARWEPLGAPPSRPAATGSVSPSSPQPDIPWPCDPPPPPDPAEWSWGPPAVPPPQPTVEVAAAVPLHPQAAAVRSCRAFFEARIEDDEEEEDAEGNAARFFGELLGGDAALRGFYEAEREKGQFLCLVCEGSGARVGKRFAGCAALVQHAGSVARTKRRLAHRAFAGAVGRLLGWSASQAAPPAAGSDSDGASQSVDMEVS
ncbi:hypothetical protein SEVIR_5G328700v4 [Setaria viridis]|uniref:Uncharacterized protein n=1 Tax=Setaria viridis TaxID=4556 RepID=A0A4V6D743_SETVI|nr:uncharacterized protein LOC117859219 [Setaria viridis]TKW16886.1 hypothetical protein SEVIR_5G328700v2 [Setaria viridis]